MCMRSVFGVALVGPPELAGNMLSFILFGPVPSQSASRDLQGRKPPGGAVMLRGTSSFVPVELRLIVCCRTSWALHRTRRTPLCSQIGKCPSVCGGVFGVDARYRCIVCVHDTNRAKHQRRHVAPLYPGSASATCGRHGIRVDVAMVAQGNHK